MIDKNKYIAYLAILREELVPAMGCTEPIAVAYAAAVAREALGKFPEHIDLRCSANIIKNVKSVTVPNTGGLKGIAAAAIAGTVGGDASKKLEVLQNVEKSQISLINQMVKKNICSATLAEGMEGLYIDVKLISKENWARVIVERTHTGITKIEKNGIVIFDEKEKKADESLGIKAGRELYKLLSVRDIWDFARNFSLEDLKDILDRQIEMNSAIAEEGLVGDYGVSVGKILVKHREKSTRNFAIAIAAAGSDARMAGCTLPVVINSGSGNQGLTVSLPVIEYAKSLKCSHEQLLRALTLANLVSLQQKEHIGKLSAYCGAVSAAVGSAAAITWLKGGSLRQIEATITNAIATAAGILCDGAKASCAAKIATALEAAILGHELVMHENKCFSSGEGLVGVDVEETIKNIGQVGSKGMRATDVEIISLMLKD